MVEFVAIIYIAPDNIQVINWFRKIGKVMLSFRNLFFYLNMIWNGPRKLFGLYFVSSPYVSGLSPRIAIRSILAQGALFISFGRFRVLFVQSKALFNQRGLIFVVVTCVKPFQNLSKAKTTLKNGFNFMWKKIIQKITGKLYIKPNQTLQRFLSMRQLFLIRRSRICSKVLVHSIF